MLSQLDLFTAPLSRVTDPATSQEAAEQVNVNRLEAIALEALERLGEATAAEIGREAARVLGVNQESVRKRLSRLERHRKVEIVDARACDTTEASNGL